MSTVNITKAVDELITLTVNGKWEEAFDKFYHEDLEKTDLNGLPIKGKQENLFNGRAFASKISNVRDFSCLGKIITEQKSFIIWSLDFDVENTPFKVVEVAIQDWKEGKIIKEQFFV